MRTTLQASLLKLLCNLVASGQGWIYYELAVAPRLEPQAADAVFRWALSSLVLSSFVVFPVHLWAFGPIRRALAAERGGTLDRATLELAQRRAVAMPVIFARASTYVWFAVILTIPAYLDASAWASISGMALLDAVTIGVVIGSVASTIVFYAIEWHARARVLPLLPGTVALPALAGLTRVSIGYKILMLVVSSVLLPLLSIGIAATAGPVSTVGILYLCACFGALGAVQGLFIAQSVFRPLRDLAGQMRRVQHRDLEAAAPVQSLDEVSELAHGFNEMVSGLKRGAWVEETFGRYVSPEVRDLILSGRVELGGQVRTATVLFADIRGFTALSERLAAPEVVRMLNDYLDRMVEVVIRNGGTIDKFIGDAIMATFGVPVARSVKEDAQAAVRAALEMAHALDLWNAERGRAGEAPLDIGIGVHTGQVVAGNIGSRRKTEYTVIGDTVNTASRLESITKQIGERILISRATCEQLDGTVACAPLGPVELKGKSQPLEVFAVRGQEPLRQTGS